MNDQGIATVLLVDDNHQNLVLLRDALRIEGLNICIATSGELALRRIREFTPDLVLLDVCMPGMDGFEVCRRLKQSDRTRDIPIIFITAIDDIIDKTNAFRLGAVDYISKPFEPLEVTARVRNHLKLSEARHKLAQMNSELERRVAERTKELEQANRNLREKEELLSKSQEIAHVGSWLLDLQNDHLTWSDETYRIFGLESKMFPGTYQGFLGSVHPDDRTRVDEAYMDSIDQEKEWNEIDHRIIRQDNDEIRYVHEMFEHCRDDSGRVVMSVGIVQDMTEQRIAEAELRASEDRFRGLVESSNDWIWEIDGEPVYTYVSPRVETILGYTPDFLLGKSLFQFMPPREAKRAKEIFTNLAGRCVPIVMLENVSLHRDGHEVFLETNGVPILDLDGKLLGYRGVTRDITERKVRDMQLRESEEYLRITLNSIGEAVISTDSKGQVVRMNPLAENLTGWTQDEAIGEDLAKVLHIVNGQTRLPIEFSLQARHFCSVFDEHREHTILVSRSGRECRLTIRAARIRTASGEERGAVLVFRDVTEEDAVQEQLRHSQKMKAFGQLAGGVAHDFNNMLCGIMGAAEMIAHTGPGPAAVRQYTDIILEASGKASELIGKLLIFSRKQPTKLDPLELHTMINNTVTILRQTIDRRIQVDMDLRAGHSVVNADGALLQNVLLNLGINASHAMPNGGYLCISSREVELDEVYCKMSTFDIKPGTYLEIEVRDTGCGIRQEDLPRIFEPFFTTKEVGKGTGLGLAAALGTMQQHEGAITVCSEEGVGTSFRLMLPLSDVVELDEQPGATVRYGTGRILVVDDEPIMRITAEAVLQSLGYEVLLADNGAQALHIYMTNAKGIDLVLLDMGMPVMNGRDCFARLKEFDSDVRVLLCSGFAREEMDEMVKDGACGVVLKPHSRASLSEAVYRALAIPDPETVARGSKK